MKKEKKVGILRKKSGEVSRKGARINKENEHNNIDEKLRQSEVKYQTLFDTMPQGVVYQDTDGRIISANPAAQRILGLRLDQMLGRTSMDPRWKSIHEDGSDFSGETHPAMVGLKTGKEVKNMVMGVFNPEDEKYRWINVNAVPQFKSGEDSPYQVYTSFDDISEYKRVRDQIKESEKGYKDLVELTTDMIFSADSEGKITFMNNTGFDILEYAPDEIMHQSFLKCIHPDDREKTSEKFKYMIENGIDVFDFENRIVSKSGRIIDFLQNVRVLRNSHNEIIGVQGIGKDITERKQIEKALQESHDILDAIRTAQSEYITDSNPQILFDNLMKNILALTNSEFGFIGEVLYKNKDEPYLKTRAITDIAWNEKIQELYDKNAPDGFEFYNLKTLFGHVMSTGKPVTANNPSEDTRRGGLPQGHPPIHSFMGLPFYHKKNLVGMVGIANRPGGYDELLIEYMQPLLITCGNIIQAYRNDHQQEKMEEELEGARNRYRKIVEDLPDLVCRYRPDTTITFVNEAYATYFGKKVDELIGTSFLDLIPAEDHDYVLKQIASFNEISPLITMEHKVITPDGQQRWQFWRDRALFESSGNITEIQSIGQDITESKQAEEELLLRAHLAELGNEIGIALSQGDSLQIILQRCAESLIKNLDAAFARIWTYNNRDEVLELQASAGMYTHLDGKYSRVPLGMFKIGRIAKNLKPNLTNQIIGDPEVHDQEWVLREKLVSFAGYPLIVDDRLVGVLALFSRKPLTDFSLKALSSAADNIANGIERKKAEMEKERYIEAIDKATDGITIADEKDRYIYVNPAYANMFGYSQVELIRDTWRKIVPPEFISTVERELSCTMQNKEVGIFNGEVPGLRKDGVIIPTEVTATGFWDKEGNYRGHVCMVRDITERKKVNEILKRSEEKYRDLFENANDSICIVDSDLKFKDVNKKTVEMLGYSKDELVQMSIFDIIPHEQVPRSEIEFQKLRRTGSYEKFIGRARTKDGSLIDVEVSSSAIKDGDKIIGSRDILRDITERVQFEEALRESEEKYRNIIEYSNDMIWIMDIEGNFEFFNKRSEEISGYRLDDWRGKTFAPLIKKEDLPHVIEVFHNTLRGKPQQYEVSVKKEDGSYFILSVNTAPIYSKGKVVGTVSFGRDITDHKKAEDAVRESEIRLQSILDNSSTVVFLKDLQGRYITINRRYEELFHVNRNDIINKTDFDIFPREYGEKFRQNDKQALEKRSAIETEEVVPQDDGLHTYISIKFPLISYDEEPYAVCGIATDITERKKSEEKIKKALKEKEVLLREVYHRVKNNMQIISSLIKLQSRYVEEERYREIFNDCQSRIKSMSLVHEKLYQSKDLLQVDFKEYIKDITRGLFQSYGAKKGKIGLIMDLDDISFDINSAIPCGLIINELVTNSLKHAFEDGRDGEIKIAIHSMNENAIELVVGDNGIGIPANIDFKRTKSLGLHLVTMLAENQLHGEINLDRSRGTEFTIRFEEVK